MNEFVPPTYLNIGEPEPARIPTVMTVERAAEFLQLTFEDVLRHINEGQLQVVRKELPEAATMTLFVEGQSVVELLRQKHNPS